MELGLGLSPRFQRGAQSESRTRTAMTESVLLCEHILNRCMRLESAIGSQSQFH
jgi:hypothetical protein